MAKKDSGKKRVYVEEYTKSDGTKVPQHYRSTPKTAVGHIKSKKGSSRDGGPGNK